MYILPQFSTGDIIQDIYVIILITRRIKFNYKLQIKIINELLDCKT